MKREVIIFSFKESKNKINKIATTIGSFLPVLPFVLFCLMTLSYFWVYFIWLLRNLYYSGTIYTVFISLIRASLIVNLLVIIKQFITIKKIKHAPFYSICIRIILFSLCAIATKLDFLGWLWAKSKEQCT